MHIADTGKYIYSNTQVHTNTVPALDNYGWVGVGHVYAQKRKGPGTKGFAFIHFLHSGMRSTVHKKYQAPPSGTRQVSQSP
jgi:hypothetical protein